MLIPIGDDNPRQKTPFVNYLFLLTNIGVFVYCILQPEKDYVQIVNEHGLVPSQWSIVDGLTSMFLHAGIFHVLGNMLLLWIAGDNIEDRLGHIPYFFFYLFCGAAAAAAQVYLTSKEGLHQPMIGASGAVAGVMGAYLIFYPKARVKLLLWVYIIVTVVRVPSWILLLFWVGMEALNAYQETQGAVTNVAVWAHLGGFVFGSAVALVIRLLFSKPKHRRD